jgi:quercetin dioxygenase-like cupin family protein
MAFERLNCGSLGCLVSHPLSLLVSFPRSMPNDGIGGNMKIFSFRLAALAVVLVFAVGVRSQNNANQTQRFPQFDNEDVKVWRSVVMPNAPLTMHRHDHPRVIIALSGGTMKIVDSQGKSEEHVWETGKAYWLPANPPGTLHADVNAGDKPIEVMVVSLEKEK